VAGSGWSTSAGWLDYDRDGRLDLFVAAISIGISRKAPPFAATAGERVPIAIRRISGATNILYHQKQDGSFEETSVKAGIAEVGTAGVPGSTGKALGVAFADFDNDGWLDIFCRERQRAPIALSQQRGRYFEDIALMAGAGYDEDGKTYAGMGWMRRTMTTMVTRMFSLPRFLSNLSALSNNGDLSFKLRDQTVGCWAKSRCSIPDGELTLLTRTTTAFGNFCGPEPRARHQLKSRPGI